MTLFLTLHIAMTAVALAACAANSLPERT